jgi:hypothetical protein
MSKLDQYETIARYAELSKTADWFGALESLVIDVGPDVVISVGPALLASLGVGAAEGAAVGVLGGPVGIGAGAIVGALITVAITSWDVYSNLAQTEIDTLLERIDSLDIPEEDAALVAKIEGWVTDLTKFKEILDAPPVKNEGASGIKDIGLRLNTLKSYRSYLSKMYSEWTVSGGVKDKATDLGLDKYKFELALNEASYAASTDISSVTTKLHNAQKMVSDQAAKIAVKNSITKSEVASMLTTRDEILLKYADLLKESGWMGIDWWSDVFSKPFKWAGFIVYIPYLLGWIGKVDNAIEKLRASIEKLDPAGMKTQVDLQKNWMIGLENFTQTLDNQSPGSDPTVVAKWATEQVGTLENLYAALKKMSADWNIVRGRFRGTISDTDTSLREAEAVVLRTLTDVKKQLQTSSKDMVAQISQTRNIDLRAISKYVMDAYKYLNSEGNKFTLDPGDETTTFSTSVSVVTGSFDPETLDQHVDKIISLSKFLAKVIAQQQLAQKSAPGTGKSAARAALSGLSKRAAMLNGKPIGTFDGAEVAVSVTPAPDAKSKQKTKTSGPVTVIQRSLNAISKLFPQFGLAHLSEDNDYGPLTGTALSSLMSQFDALSKEIRGAVGLSAEAVKDAGQLKENHDALQAISTILSKYAASVSQGGETTVQQQVPYDESKKPLELGKEGTMDALRKRSVIIRDQNINAYEAFKSILRYTDDRIFEYMASQYKNVPAGEWPMSNIASFIDTNRITNSAFFSPTR